MCKRLVAMLLQFSFEIRFVPGSCNYGPDFLSRYHHKRNKPLKEVFDLGDEFADFAAIDEVLFRDISGESTDDFMARTKKNQDLIIQLEKNIGHDDADVRETFAKSHVFKC